MKKVKIYLIIVKVRPEFTTLSLQVFCFAELRLVRNSWTGNIPEECFTVHVSGRNAKDQFTATAKDRNVPGDLGERLSPQMLLLTCPLV